MNTRITTLLAAGSLVLAAGCFSADKGKLAADTQAASSTVLAAPDSTPISVTPDTVSSDAGSANGPAEKAPATKAPATKGSVSASTASRTPKRTTSTDTLIGWDSVIKPRATIDTKGNVQPIKRDSLR